MPGLAEEAKSLCTCVVEMEEASEINSSEVWTRCKAADLEFVAKQARTKRAEHTAWIAQLEGGLQPLKGILDFFERRDNVADSRYCL